MQYYMNWNVCVQTSKITDNHWHDQEHFGRETENLI